MSDTYQAVYDAVRSRISGGNVGEVVREIAWQAFDFSRAREHLIEEIICVSHEMQRPSAIFRPSLAIDGNKWSALYGSNLAEGVSGFGDSPSEAMADFDKAWNEKLCARAALKDGSARS
jgi:hypothetical protein